MNLNTINMSPRTVVRWEGGKKTEHPNTTPEHFGKERAEAIAKQAQEYAKSSPWVESIHRFMTLGEEAYVHAVWDAIPSGQSCWFDAFNLIWKGVVK